MSQTLVTRVAACFVLASVGFAGATLVQNRGLGSSRGMHIQAEEIQTPIQWSTVLRCNFEPSGSDVKDCSDIWWSRVANADDVFFNDVKGGGNGVQNGGLGDGRNSSNNTSKAPEVISTGDVAYRVEKELTNLTSRLVIFRAEELLKGRYQCTVACGSQTFNRSCVVTEVEHRNRSFECTDQTVLNPPYFDNIHPSALPHTMITHPSQADNTLTSIAAHAHGATDTTTSSSSSANQGAYLATSAVSALAFFLILVMLLRWYVKRKVTAKRIHELRITFTRQQAQRQLQPNSQQQHSNGQTVQQQRSNGQQQQQQQISPTHNGSPLTDSPLRLTLPPPPPYTPTASDPRANSQTNSPSTESSSRSQHNSASDEIRPMSQQTASPGDLRSRTQPSSPSIDSMSRSPHSLAPADSRSRPLQNSALPDDRQRPSPLRPRPPASGFYRPAFPSGNIQHGLPLTSRNSRANSPNRSSWNSPRNSRSNSPRNSRSSSSGFSAHPGSQLRQAQTRLLASLMQTSRDGRDTGGAMLRQQLDVPSGSRPYTAPPNAALFNDVRTLCVLKLPSYEDAVAEAQRVAGNPQATQQLSDQQLRSQQLQQQLHEQQIPLNYQQYLQHRLQHLNELRNHRQNQQQSDCFLSPNTIPQHSRGQYSPPPPYRSTQQLCSEDSESNTYSIIQPNLSTASGLNYLSRPPSYHSAMDISDFGSGYEDTSTSSASASSDDVSDSDDVISGECQDDDATAREGDPLMRGESFPWRRNEVSRFDIDTFSEERRRFLTESGRNDELDVDQSRYVQWPTGRPPPVYE